MFRSLVIAVLSMALTNSCTQVSPPPSLKDNLTEKNILFDGSNLDQFDYIGGDIWTLPGDGTVKGMTTEEKKVKRNTFLISKNKTFADFEATLSYKLTTLNNSGVIYRAEQIDDPALFRVKGYQAEGENDLLKGGFMYDEARRAWVASPGELVIVKSKKDKKIVGQVNDHEKLIQNKFLNDKEWNDYRIVARGNHFMHYINGELAIELIDIDPVDSSRTGAFCLQIHQGKPMTVFFKDVVVNKYKSEFGKAIPLFISSLKGWKTANAETKVSLFSSPNEKGLKARGYDTKAKLKSTVAVIAKDGSIGHTLPKYEGVLRFHIKGEGKVKLGDQSFEIPSNLKSADGYAHVEFLLKDGQVEFSVNNTTLDQKSFKGAGFVISGESTVRNVIFIPFEK